jgi:hypothetical protein
VFINKILHIHVLPFIEVKEVQGGVIITVATSADPCAQPNDQKNEDSDNALHVC